MAKRIVDYDPYTGITTTFDYTPDGVVILGREQDVTALLDFNKRLANDPEYSKRGIKESWWHFASYPAIIIEKWLNEYGVNVYNKDHAEKVQKLTNQPEYRYLKTTAKMV